MIDFDDGRYVGSMFEISVLGDNSGVLQISMELFDRGHTQAGLFLKHFNMFTIRQPSTFATNFL